MLGGILGGIAGALVGGSMAKSNAKDAAIRQHEMNKELYQYRYRWAVKDMKKAGLNPILAASQGQPLASSSAVQAPAPDLAGAITHGLSASSSAKLAREQAKGQAALMRAQSVQAIASATQAEAQAAKAHQEGREAAARATMSEMEARMAKENPEAFWRRQYQPAGTRNLHDTVELIANTARRGAEGGWNMLKDVNAAMTAKSQADRLERERIAREQARKRKNP